METVRVERGTRASYAFAVVAVLALAALVAMPWWGDAGQMRLVAEMAYYLALAQLWNLLAGYAGLVSVGQQAYVGLGAYALFYLTGALNVNVYVALLIAGPFAGLMSIPVSIAVFRLRGAYFAIGTWVVSEVFALSASLIAVLGAGSGLSLTPAIVRQIAPDRAGPRGHALFDVACDLRDGVRRRLSAAALAPWAGADGDPRLRAGVGQPRRQHLPHQVHHLHRDRGLHRSGRRADLSAEASHLAGGRLQHQRLDGGGDLHGGDRRHRHASRGRSSACWSISSCASSWPIMAPTI